MATVPCPFGCGYQIDTKKGNHPVCPKVKETDANGCVPWGKRIDLARGERGGLPEDFVMPVLDTAGKVKCRFCRKWVVNYHYKCDSYPGKELKDHAIDLR